MIWLSLTVSKFNRINHVFLWTNIISQYNNNWVTNHERERSTMKFSIIAHRRYSNDFSQNFLRHSRNVCVSIYAKLISHIVNCVKCERTSNKSCSIVIQFEKFHLFVNFTSTVNQTMNDWMIQIYSCLFLNFIFSRWFDLDQKTTKKLMSECMYRNWMNVFAFVKSFEFRRIEMFNYETILQHRIILSYEFYSKIMCMTRKKIDEIFDENARNLDSMLKIFMFRR